VTLRAPGRPLVAAHRGGALLWPENSLTAFRGALGLGADLVELDVHRAKDGEVVVIHDPTLDRTTAGRGPVRDHLWAALAELALKGTRGEAMPRLRQVLDLLAPTKVGLLLEIKVGPDGVPYPGIEERALDLLGKTGLTERTTIMAFDWTILERARKLSSTVRLTGLVGHRDIRRLGGVAAAAARVAALTANDLGLEHTLLSPVAVEAARAAGLTLGVWTVNEPAALRVALAADIDYVTTDRPDLALQLRAAG
jgi:glycerophosphoryl diester phosphodiesterase